MKDYRKEYYKARANLKYYKDLYKEYKKEITFTKYEIRLLEGKISRLKKKLIEKDYLIVELLKKVE